VQYQQGLVVGGVPIGSDSFVADFLDSVHAESLQLSQAINSVKDSDFVRPGFLLVHFRIPVEIAMMRRANLVTPAWGLWGLAFGCVLHLLELGTKRNLHTFESLMQVCSHVCNRQSLSQAPRYGAPQNLLVR
jgi:hypothetical protein